jgi:erythronate-4-phosphate dehydrogenase
LKDIKCISFTIININTLKIIADDKIPFLKGVLEPFADIIYLPGGRISRDDLVNADALLIRTRTKCTESLLNGTSIKFIGTATIGFDHIDIACCRRNNIAWINAPGCNSSSVQQYITAALLKLEHEHNFILKNRTLGIIGAGNVGSKVEKAAKALGMNVLLNDPPRARREGSSSFVELEKLLQQSDIITLHVPLNIVGEDQTYHLFNGENFNKIKKGTWFLNSSRGEVTETSALKKALSSGKLEGAILDVWENEPDIDQELISASYIATPHIAGYSTDGKANGTAMVVSSICSYFGLPLHEWYPDDVPEPDLPQIEINCSDKSDSDIIREAVVHTYSISEDDEKLRRSPSDFEKLRGDYRLRREFSAFTVKLTDGTDKVSETLKNLGLMVR